MTKRHLLGRTGLVLVSTMLMACFWKTMQAQELKAHFDMTLNDGANIAELVTNHVYAVSSQLPACDGEGLDGRALRFDGWSNYVKAGIDVSSLSAEQLTLSVVLAAETYPMMKTDVAEDTPTFATICGNLVDKQGFALQLSSQGDLRFQFGSAYANGYLFSINGTKKLPRGRWCRVDAVLDKSQNSAALYLNGESIGTSRMSRSDIVHGNDDFYIGKDGTDVKSGPFLLNTFCGLIDDISIYSTPLTPVDWEMADVRPNFNYPAFRYGFDENGEWTEERGEGHHGLWRPLFHGMPSGSWTNETHGMIYSDGRWHTFFQKNANGPYMSRLHWGHISSENLCDWREELIAIAPGENYDIKGCWSGCAYEDEGTPYIIYTAVDNAKATIAQAKAVDASLEEWEKLGVIINGRPAGLSDDFRDPYFFKANGKKYIIVGTSKNGIGACTLHRYENGAWTNDGSIFFQGVNANQHGTFWEMPNITPMDNGKWLFTCTPLNTGVGVRTLYWVGTIGTDGKFTPDANGVQYLEMGGISRDGFGLLSPTIYQKDGKTLLLGIVPDKLPTQTNFEMGWAHNYSLPREIGLDTNGRLVQKPYEGLKVMRTQTKSEWNGELSGTLSLAPVEGRQVEMMGTFTIGTGEVGFRFLKSGSRQGELTYDAERGTLTLDLTSLDRRSNDGGIYNGIYSVALPERVAAGETLKLHVFLDGSIADIFVNDRWAFSVRMFPNDVNQTEVEAFATSATKTTIKAWTLNPKQQSTGDATGLEMESGEWRGEYLMTPDDMPSFYDLQGRLLPAPPQNGLFILRGRKYYFRS